MMPLAEILLLLLAFFVGGSDGPRAPSSGEESQLPRLGEVPAKYQVAAQAVAAVLADEGEEPKEFRAKVVEKDGGGTLVFHLWHDSAFTPEHAREIGNPGGRCRDVVYDVRSRKASQSVFWQ